MKLEIIQRDIDSDDPLYASSDCQQLLTMYQDFYPEIGYHPPWVGYFIIRNDQIVGSCGFTGKPEGGKVELAYWTFPGFEGEGISSFACGELVRIARQEDPSLIITAKTAPEYNASTRILQKNGFHFSEVVQDHEIGDAWLWIL